MKSYADIAEECFAMEQDVRNIADSIHALAVRMDGNGYPAEDLLNAMTDVVAVGLTFAILGDIALQSKS